MAQLFGCDVDEFLPTVLTNAFDPDFTAEIVVAVLEGREDVRQRVRGDLIQQVCHCADCRAQHACVRLAQCVSVTVCSRPNGSTPCRKHSTRRCRRATERLQQQGNGHRTRMPFRLNSATTPGAARARVLAGSDSGMHECTPVWYFFHRQGSERSLAESRTPLEPPQFVCSGPAQS